MTDDDLDARMEAHRAEAKIKAQRRTAERTAAREDSALQAALREWLTQGWTPIAAAANYLRGQKAGAMTTAYGRLSRADQITVTRTLLENMQREGFADQAYGPGEKKSGVITYIARSKNK